MFLTLTVTIQYFILPFGHSVAQSKCVHSNMTIKQAIDLQEKENKQASRYNTLEGVRLMFRGLRGVPSDLAIEINNSRMQITYPTDIRTLPSMDLSQSSAALIPPYEFKPDCIVVGQDGNRWLAFYDLSHRLSYVEASHAMTIDK